MSQPDSHAPHFSVLWRETLDGLNLRPGKRYLDGTLGSGGHSYGILQETAPDGLVLGLDADPVALNLARERLKPFGDRARLVQGNFADMVRHAHEEDFAPIAGVVLDLGVSSMQLDDLARGFSFRGEGLLDMRFGPRQGKLTAADIVNGWSEAELTRIFFELGEEPQARRFARAIVEDRKHQRFETTGQLAALLERIGSGKAAGRDKKPIHPATRVFQALRMTVNRELERLQEGLAGAVEILEPGGRLAVITFHSLEDRVVKNFIRDAASDKQLLPGLPASMAMPKIPVLRPITKKPLEAGPEELAANRRSRSAKLRVAEKL